MLYQIKYTINHGFWIEPVSLTWTDDKEFIKGMIIHLKKSNATDIRVVKQVDATGEFMEVI